MKSRKKKEHPEQLPKGGRRKPKHKKKTEGKSGPVVLIRSGVKKGSKKGLHSRAETPVGGGMELGCSVQIEDVRD